uniref:Uncharacterized protein n=1 Tax=Glossina pallidipes TaxID=7398 RepID=A0A1A9Z0P6_GLOPL
MYEASAKHAFATPSKHSTASLNYSKERLWCERLFGEKPRMHDIFAHKFMSTSMVARVKSYQYLVIKN